MFPFYERHGPNSHDTGFNDALNKHFFSTLVKHTKATKGNNGEIVAKTTLFEIFNVFWDQFLSRFLDRLRPTLSCFLKKSEAIVTLFGSFYEHFGPFLAIFIHFLQSSDSF